MNSRNRYKYLDRFNSIFSLDVEPVFLRLTPHKGSTSGRSDYGNNFVLLLNILLIAIQNAIQKINSTVASLEGRLTIYVGRISPFEVHRRTQIQFRVGTPGPQITVKAMTRAHSQFDLTPINRDSEQPVCLP
jgi:hypothetical protein